MGLCFAHLDVIPAKYYLEAWDANRRVWPFDAAVNDAFERYPHFWVALLLSVNVSSETLADSCFLFTWPCRTRRTLRPSMLAACLCCALCARRLPPRLCWLPRCAEVLLAQMLTMLTMLTQRNVGGDADRLNAPLLLQAQRLCYCARLLLTNHTLAKPITALKLSLSLC